MKAISLSSSIGISVVLSLALAVAGWQDQSRRRTVESSPQEEVSTGRRARPVRPTGSPEDVTRRMNAIRSANSPAERIRATIALANSLSPSEISAWLDSGWFNVRGGPEVMIFSGILKERWETEDPESFARWALRSEPDGAGGAISSWGRKDPAAAQSLLLELPPNLNTINALSSLARKDPTLAARILEKMAAKGLPNNLANYLSTTLREIAKTDPALIEAMSQSLPANMTRSLNLALSNARLTSAFPEELRRL